MNIQKNRWRAERLHFRRTSNFPVVVRGAELPFRRVLCAAPERNYPLHPQKGFLHIYNSEFSFSSLLFYLCVLRNSHGMTQHVSMLYKQILWILKFIPAASASAAFFLFFVLPGPLPPPSPQFRILLRLILNSLSTGVIHCSLFVPKCLRKYYISTLFHPQDKMRPCLYPFSLFAFFFFTFSLDSCIYI